MRRLTASASFGAALCILLLSAPSVPAGQELQLPVVFQTPRDARPDQDTATGTASITGAVVVAGTGQPARKARVTLSGAELRGSRRAVTDEFGRFAFAGLPAGRYSLAASKPGHVSVSYGQRVPEIGRAHV